jgi:hypothetical protein
MTSKASRVTERLQHIRGAIENAKNDLGALTKEQFLADGKTQRAVIESIMVIGESANSIMRLAPHLEQQSPDLWQHFPRRIRHANHPDARVFQGGPVRCLGHDQERPSEAASPARWNR